MTPSPDQTLIQPQLTDTGELTSAPAVQPGVPPPGSPATPPPSPSGPGGPPPPPPGQPAAPQGQQPPPQPVDPLSVEGLAGRLQDIDKQRKALVQALQQEQNPDAIFKYLPNAGKSKPSDALRDAAYNFAQLQATSFGGLRGQTYKPIEQQRLETAKDQQQVKLKTFVDQLQALSGEDTQTKTLLQAKQFQDTQAGLAQRAQATIDQKDRVLAQTKATSDLMNEYRVTKLLADQGNNTAKLKLTEILGRMKVDANIATHPMATLLESMKGPNGELPDLTDPKVLKQVQTLAANLNPALSVVTVRSGSSTPNANGRTDTTSTSQKRLLDWNQVGRPGAPGTKPAPPTASAGAAPPVPLSQPTATPPGSQPKTIANVPRAFDDNNPIDRAARLIGQDDANWKGVGNKTWPGGPPTQAQVRARMTELRIDPNHVDASVRDRAAVATTMIPHLDEINSLIAQAKATPGAMGILATQWNKLLSGSPYVGIDPTPNKIFSKLQTELDFGVSAAAMAHGGARAAGSPAIIDKWKSTMQANDPDTLSAKLGEARKWIQGYAEMAGRMKPASGDVQNAIDRINQRMGAK